MSITKKQWARLREAENAIQGVANTDCKESRAYTVALNKLREAMSMSYIFNSILKD